MSDSNDRLSLRSTILTKVAAYSKRASQLGLRVRQLVFGFRLRSTAHSDLRALPVKLIHQHRIIQRWRAHNQSGGHRSSIAQHALSKARGDRQQT
jgi:hypothetical protein